MKQQWAIYSEPAATKRSSAPPPNDRKATVNSSKQNRYADKTKKNVLFSVLPLEQVGTEGSKEKVDGRFKEKKNLLADTVIREINKEDSLHKPWAPVFQMIVAVTVFLVSGTNAHTHTHQLRKMNIFPTLAEHTLPCRGHTRIRRRSPHKHCTIGIATPPFSLFFFSLSFLSFTVVCARAQIRLSNK